MGKSRAGLVAVGVVAVMGATDVAAQNVEAIMRARERLELTAAQLESLEAFRRAAVQERTAEMVEREELRSQLEAGQIQRSEMMAFMEERREGRQTLAEQRREQVESVLTEEQLETLQDLRPRRGRGVGVRPGGRSGLDGPGFAPRGRAEARGPQGPLRGPPRAAFRGAPGRRGGDAPPFSPGRRPG